MENITRKDFSKTVRAAIILGVSSICIPKAFATEGKVDEMVVTSDTQYNE